MSDEIDLGKARQIARKEADAAVQKRRKRIGNGQDAVCAFHRPILDLRKADHSWEEVAQALQRWCGLELSANTVKAYTSKVNTGDLAAWPDESAERAIELGSMPTDSARGNTAPAEEQPDLTVPQKTHRPNPIPTAAPADQLRQGVRGDIDGRRGSVAGREPERRRQSGSNLSDDGHSDDATPDRLR